MKGHVDILKWWYSKYLPYGRPPGATLAVLRIAAFHGHLNILKGGFFCEEVTLKTIDEMSPSVICQHPEIVRWIRSKSLSTPLIIMLDHAIEQGDVAFGSWIYKTEGKHTVVATHKGVREAAQAGYLTMLKWLRDYDPRIMSDMALHRAATAGHLDIVKWLYDNELHQASLPPNADCVVNGHIDVVK